METKRRVLVIEDESSAREDICTILKDEGYDTDSAKDGDEALVKILKVSYELIIMDLKMPGKIAELDLLDAIKERYPEQRVIVETGYYKEAETATSAMKRGACDYLTKPISDEQLISAVEKALEPIIQFEERRKREDEIYEKYREELEKHHKGEFVAISFDTEEIIRGKDEVKVVKKAINKFGSGKYLFKRIGYPYVHVVKKGALR